MNSYTRGYGFFESFLAKQRANKANSLIPKNYRKGRILDIGCGSYPYFLISTNFNKKYGTDPSVNKNLVKNKSINLYKIKISKNKLKFKENFFDVVTMLAVFEHIEHDELIGVLKEIRRILKKDGVLIITTPAPWADKLLHFMAVFNLISKEEIHEHKHNHPRERIKDFLKTSGFSKNNVKSGFFEFGLNMWFTTIK